MQIRITDTWNKRTGAYIYTNDTCLYSVAGSQSRNILVSETCPVHQTTQARPRVATGNRLLLLLVVLQPFT